MTLFQAAVLTIGLLAALYALKLIGWVCFLIIITWAHDGWVRAEKYDPASLERLRYYGH